MKSKNKFIKIMSIVVLTLMLITTFVSKAFAEGTTPSNHIIDKVGILDQYNKDKMGKIGNELNSGKVELIYSIETRIRNNDANALAKDTYYDWLNKLEQNTRLVVVVYYVDDNEFGVYQEDNNLVSNKTLKKLKEEVANYRKDNNLNGGMLYSYSKVSSEIAGKIDVKLVNTNDIEYTYKPSIMKMMPIIFLGMITFVIGLGFRKRK